MPAALKTPLPEPDFAPDNSSSTSTSTLSPPAAPAKPASQASARAAAAAVSGASSRAASPARISLRERPLEHEVAARPARPVGRPERDLEQAAALSRPERRHRRFRPTITATLCGCALMGQLVLLLWLHGKTLTAAREVEKMDTQIADVSNHIERTQERIAAFDSSPQIKQWAAQKGWRPATHLDIDDATKADQARAVAQAEAQAQAQDKSGEVEAR